MPIFIIKRRIKKGMGLIESPEDPRDYNILSIFQPQLEPLESVYSDYDDLPILAQGKTPYCVAYSSSSMKMRQEQKEHNKVIKFNAFWLYNKCKEIDGYPDVDGTFIRAAMKVLKAEGVPSSLPLNKLGLGTKYKIDSYYRVPKDIYTMKLAIKQFGPVVIGTKWKNSWFTPLHTGVLPRPDSDAGGHAVLQVGWNDTIVTQDGLGAFECVNSWSDRWGKKGRFYLPYSYIKYVTEAYKAVDQKDVTQPTPDISRV